LRHARSVKLAEPAAASEPATLDSPLAIEIWTDGACRGNPGPGGWGALMRSGEHVR